jgi:hypothetical protein
MGDHTLAGLEDLLAALEEIFRMNERYKVLLADAISADGLQPILADPRFEVFENRIEGRRPGPRD